MELIAYTLDFCSRSVVFKIKRYSVLRIRFFRIDITVFVEISMITQICLQAIGRFDAAGNTVQTRV